MCGRTPSLMFIGVINFINRLDGEANKSNEYMQFLQEVANEEETLICQQQRLMKLLEEELLNQPEAYHNTALLDALFEMKVNLKNDRGENCLLENLDDDNAGNKSVVLIHTAKYLGIDCMKWLDIKDKNGLTPIEKMKENKNELLTLLFLQMLLIGEDEKLQKQILEQFKDRLSKNEWDNITELLTEFINHLK